MKKIMLILGCWAPLALLLSCSDWMNVQPKAEIKLDVMFETEQGVKDALIGCYILMSDNALYGAELTCRFLDVLGQQYVLLGSTASRYDDAAHYIYTEEVAEGIINGIWSGQYNVIANINALIEGIENSREVLPPTIYALSKAEAYSLRAFVYLDLVRLFTRGNLSERQDQLEQLAIPYPKIYDKEIVPQETLGKVLKYIHEDLEVALELFEAYDPLSKTGTRPDDYIAMEKDKFYGWDSRKFRMNLKGAMATRMRLNLWEGNYGAAKEDANYLIKLGHGFVKSMDWDEHERDLTFSAEMLFGVETFERFDKIVIPSFKLTLDDGSSMNYQALYLPKTRVEDLYEIKTGVGSSDWRYTRLWDKTENNYVFLKFWEYEDMVNTDRMPLIKYPEVYYTLCECLLREGNKKDEVIKHLNFIRNQRNIPVELNIPYTLTEEEAWKELEKEMCKEYIGEGQMFYYYKRIGASSIPNGPAVSYDDNVYVLPMPQKEIDFGGRVK